MHLFWKDSAAVRPDRMILSRTLCLLTVCGVVAFAALTARLWNVQIKDHDRYESMAIEQQTKETRIPAKRGTIYDRNGNAMAVSATAYSVYICPFELKRYGEDAQAVAAYLAETLELDYDSVLKKCGDASTWYKTIKTKITPELADELRAYISANQLHSLHIEEDTKRIYPYGTVACHLLGFTGVDGNGLEGLEAQYDGLLAGENGSVSRLAAGDGSQMLLQSYEAYNPGKDGCDLNLTVDLDIQYIAEKYLDQAIADYDVQNGGCCIVMDVNTGGILAMASRENYDPNDYLAVSDEVQAQIGSITDADARKGALAQARLAQWRNRAISDTYEPGSVFKVVTLAMGLESGAVTEGSSFYCGGTTTVPGRGKPLRCWKSTGHGSQNLTEAVQHSCNVAFCRIGLSVGAPRFYDFVERFGLFSKTGIDLPGEAGSQWWTWDVFCSETNLSQLAAASFGQTFNITPVQLAAAISSIVNGGTSVSAHTVQSVTDSDGEIVYEASEEAGVRVVSSETSSKVCGILEQVVSGKGGTGRNAYVAGYRIGGKTGTSEKVAQDAAGGAKEYIVSFCGVAPIDDPEILVLFLLDTPGAQTGIYISGGVMAAPAVGNILSEVLPYLGYEAQYTDTDSAVLDAVVPDLSGMTAQEAQQAVGEAGFACRTVGRGGTVTGQLPAAGAEIAAGSKILIYLDAAGYDSSAAVPDLTGMTFIQARTALETAGLYMDTTGAWPGNEDAVVTAQSEEEGARIPCGGVIHVTLTDCTDTGQ